MEPPFDGEEAFLLALRRGAPRLESIVLNANRRRWLSVSASPRTGRPRASVHRALAAAGPAEHRALLAFLGGSPTAADRGILRAFMERHAADDAGPAPAPPPAAAVPRSAAMGRHRDLVPIADAANRAFFGGRLGYAIAWNNARGRLRPGQGIRLGGCSVAARRILVHRLLDHPAVPDYFVEFVVHHELCHLAAPPEAPPGSSRRIVHGPRFRALERLFPRYADAKRWEAFDLPRLMAQRLAIPLPPGR